MTFQRYQSPEHPDWQKIWQLYQQSFPPCELRLEKDQRQAMETRPDFFCMGIFEGKTFLGLIFYWNPGDYCYVEHFAIDPRHRGRQYGSRCLREFCRAFPQVILEIDPPEDEISVRRLRFYENLGFLRSEYEHLHPPYRLGDEPHRLLALSYPHPLSARQQQDFLRYREGEVLQFSEPRRAALKK